LRRSEMCLYAALFGLSRRPVDAGFPFCAFCSPLTQTTFPPTVRWPGYRGGALRSLSLAGYCQFIMAGGACPLAFFFFLPSATPLVGPDANPSWLVFHLPPFFPVRSHGSSRLPISPPLSESSLGKTPPNWRLLSALGPCVECLRSAALLGSVLRGAAYWARVLHSVVPSRAEMRLKGREDQFGEALRTLDTPQPPPGFQNGWGL